MQNQRCSQQEDLQDSIPTAIVLSNREPHDNVPVSSSTSGLSPLELVRFDIDPDVWNCTIRADGKLYRTSVCGSAPKGPGIGEVAARRGRVKVGVDDAIAASARE
jgi:hypothetical protein